MKYTFIIAGYTFTKWADNEQEAYNKAKAHYNFMTDYRFA